MRGPPVVEGVEGGYKYQYEMRCVSARAPQNQSGTHMGGDVASLRDKKDRNHLPCGGWNPVVGESL